MGRTLLSVIGCELDLDQLMALQRSLDLTQHGLGQPFRADDHDRMKRVRSGS
ncbi:MAG: hypothetical protein MUF80_06650 [Burkholderiales bacterium]|nr:hypothetical protein [Burkholderiales bacterium]